MANTSEESFLCNSCRKQDGRPMNRLQMIEHLQTEHKVRPPLAGKRSMLMHIKGEGFSAMVYEWTFAEIKVTQTLNHAKR